MPLNFTPLCVLLQCSWIDGRAIEPRCTYPVPPEQQLRHWMSRQAAMEQQHLQQQQYLLSTSPSSAPPPSTPSEPPSSPPTPTPPDPGLRIAWVRLHNLSPRPVYAVDNRSGEALDLFAIFNTVASSFVNVSLGGLKIIRLPKCIKVDSI